MNNSYRGRRAAKLPAAANSQNATPASPGHHARLSSEQADEIARQIAKLGKLAVSRLEAQRLFPYGARTFRRLELAGHLHPLKATRTVVYSVAELLRFIQEVR